MNMNIMILRPASRWLTQYVGRFKSVAYLFKRDVVLLLQQCQYASIRPDLLTAHVLPMRAAKTDTTTQLYGAL